MLKPLKFVIRMIIIESFESDKKDLMSQFPEQINDIKTLGPKWISWLSSRFGSNKSRDEVHPFEDSLSTVLAFSKKDAAIAQKYNSSEQWRQAVDEKFPPQKRKWKIPSDASTMTVDDMETLLAMSQRKKQNVDVRATSNVEQDRIGKIGPWNLWMPTTRENSCEIAGYDPATMEPHTTWCTARTSGSNLFYNYVSKPNVILFYIIRENAQNANDRLSIGFVNKKPYLAGENGGLTVNGENNGLTEENLRQILGSSYESIMSKLSSVASSMSGQHPAAKKIDEAAQSFQAFQSMMNGLSKEEADDLKMYIVNKNLSDEVATQLAQDKNSFIRLSIARNYNTSTSVLAQLAQDAEFQIRANVAKHSNTSPIILARLAQDKETTVRAYTALNVMASLELLTLLAQDEDASVRECVAKNLNTSTELLVRLARDKNTLVRENVANHPNTSADTLFQLAKDSDIIVRKRVVKNPNISANTFLLLAKDRNSNIRSSVALEPNTPAEILTLLAKDKVARVKKYVSMNHNTPKNILHQLMQDADFEVRKYAEENLKLRQQIEFIQKYK